MIWRVVGVVGELLAILGIVLIGYLAYQTWGKLEEIDDSQAQLDQQLSQSWQEESEPAPNSPGAQRARPAGSPMIRLSIPRLGRRWTVVEGTGLANLRAAPGHYRGSQLPGELGNFAVAAHRSPGLFWDLDIIRAGDEIIVEDRDTRYVYRADDPRIVSPAASEVLAPVPGQPGAEPVTARITLTTCNPKWDNYERLIIGGQLESATPKTMPSGGT
ncbi:class E sortase [Amycolatopsis suaedae]|uniref:class E sortase n=1 Tax=Amycolatopsis suaedae TaxID=2510978 RepID=UPI0013EF0FE7|nr:class E sortase [Amycolatopsis suaedae]